MPDDRNEDRNKDSVDERVRAVQRLTELFRLERRVYLLANVVALAILLASACSLIIRSDASPSVLTSLFGSTGVITYSTGRFITMWSTAMRFVMNAGLDGGRN